MKVLIGPSFFGLIGVFELICFSVAFYTGMYVFPSMTTGLLFEALTGTKFSPLIFNTTFVGVNFFGLNTGSTSFGTASFGI